MENIITGRCERCTSDEWPAEEGAREHEHGAEGEEPSEEEEEEPLVVAAVHVQRVRGVAPLDQRALRGENDLHTVGISTRENVLALLCSAYNLVSEGQFFGVWTHR